MQVIVDILKRYGKAGGWALILMGIGGFITTGVGVFNVGFVESGSILVTGLSLLGIRGAQDK